MGGWGKHGFYAVDRKSNIDKSVNNYPECPTHVQPWFTVRDQIALTKLHCKMQQI